MFKKVSTISEMKYLKGLVYFLNGNLNAVNKARDSSAFFAVVVMVTSIPRNLSILSY